MIFSTRLESFSNMENAWLPEATTGGGSEFENRYGLKEKLLMVKRLINFYKDVVKRIFLKKVICPDIYQLLGYQYLDRCLRRSMRGLLAVV